MMHKQAFMHGYLSKEGALNSNQLKRFEQIKKTASTVDNDPLKEKLKKDVLTGAKGYGVGLGTVGALQGVDGLKDLFKEEGALKGAATFLKSPVTSVGGLSVLVKLPLAIAAALIAKRHLTNTTK